MTGSIPVLYMQVEQVLGVRVEKFTVRENILLVSLTVLLMILSCPAKAVVMIMMTPKKAECSMHY